MADHENDTDPNNAAPAPADASAEGGSSEGDSNSGNENQNNANASDGDGGASSEDNKGNKADEGGDKGNDVETRRHNQQNAATRIATKNTAPASSEGGEGGDESDISKVHADLADLRSREEAREDEAEMDKIIADNPDMAKYKAEVKKLSSDTSRKQVPIKSLFYEAAGDDLIKIGANRASEANADAAETQQNGTSTGNSPDGASVSDMSNDDFAKMQEDVRLKQ